MRIVIGPDVCADDVQWRFLDRIVDKIADGWHGWVIEDPQAIEETGWLNGRDWLREFFHKAALASGYPTSSGFPRRQVVVSLLGRHPAEFSPQQAAEYVSTPFAILMENRFTDGIFLDAVLDMLAPSEMNEQRRTAPHSIRYDSPGGNGELPKLVADYAKRAKAKGIPIRAVVFADSDGTVSGEVQRNARLVRETCEREGVPCWILQKRTIENYIPNEVLDEKDRIVAALKRLNPEQRDHYPMKKGLKLQGASPDVQSLYAGISAADQKELATGLGKNVIEKLQDYREALTVEALRRRDGQGELDRLVKMIADEL